jgi:membrane-bound serine protease (ClpP class)
LAIALVLASHITSMREGTILESPGGSAQALKAAGVESVEGFADKREKKAQIWRDFWLAPRSASAAQALREGLVEFNSSGLTEFLRELDGRVVPLRMRGQGKVRSYRRLVLDGARVEERRLGPLAGVLQALSHPNIAALLLGAGLLLLILELARGGAGIAGVIGGAALFAALVGFQMLPLRAGALPALILGMGLPVMEIPFKRRGVFSIPGGLALGWALHFLVDRAALPSGVDLWLAIAIGVLVAVFPLVVGRFNCPARG